MKPCSASAPGKLLILGEYAVLGGGSGIGTAVEPRARVRIEPARGGRGSVRAPGLTEEAAAFRLDGAELRWCDPGSGEAFAIVDAVFAELAPYNAQPFDALLDTQEFRRDRSKLGFGSSAALAVALDAALAAATGAAPDMQRAVRAHRRFQGGRGSGADVAISSTGGHCVTDTRAAGLTVESVDWPAGLLWRWIDTGQPASTPAMIGRFERARSGSAAFRHRFDALNGLAAEAVTHWKTGVAQETLGAIDAFAEALHALDREGSLGVYSNGHGTLRRIGRENGVVCKPSGAGGGDLAIAFASDPAALSAFSARAVDAGFRVVAPRAAPDGVLVEW